MKKLFLVLFLLFPSLCFADAGFIGLVGSGEGCVGNGEVGSTATTGTFTSTNDTLYYSEFTAVPGITSYAHVFTGFLSGYNIAIGVYNTSGELQFEHFEADAGTGDGVWQNYELDTSWCLAGVTYLVGVTHARPSSAKIYEGEDTGNELRSIAMSCDNSLEDFTPGSSSLIKSDSAIKVVINDTATSP